MPTLPVTRLEVFPQLWPSESFAAIVPTADAAHGVDGHEEKPYITV